MRRLERMFKAMGQMTRLKIIFLLAEQELCVCELEYLLGISQSAVSQHMRVLKDAELVTEERKGQWVFYRLNKDAIRQHLSGCLAIMEGGLVAAGEMAEDLAKLRHLQANPIVPCRVPQQDNLNCREG